MSDPFDERAPSADEPSDEELSDPAELQSAGDLDEDELGTDPMEGGVEPPSHWSTVTRRRPTPSERSEDDDLDERLAQQRPDFGAEEDTAAGDEAGTAEVDEGTEFDE
ncbi:hypothetical protein [Actinopolyspora mortivallis]|uniref:hypothetical protein n=1 Tax=Actinopolyspora mortivallis TaxID=33906 RepID=UPI00037928D2|nr:hypothetical protein [Actinopolyspora mortivallis]